MNKYMLAAIFVAGFIVGDAEGIIRANRKSKKVIAVKEERESLLKLKSNSLIEYIEDTRQGVPHEDARNKLFAALEFIKIAYNI